MGIGDIGLPGLLLIVCWGITIVAFWKLLPKAGFNPVWALVALFPLFALILFWVIAFKKWPGDEA